MMKDEPFVNQTVIDELNKSKSIEQAINEAIEKYKKASTIVDILSNPITIFLALFVLYKSFKN